MMEALYILKSLQLIIVNVQELYQSLLSILPNVGSILELFLS